MRKTTIWAGLLVFLSALSANGQSAIDAAGGSVSSGNERLDFAIGEIATTTLSNGQVHLTQGVLQPLVATVGADEAFDARFQLTAFPNPLGGELTIETDCPDFEQIEVIDATGRTLRTEAWRGQIVDFQPFAPGNYAVRLRGGLFFKTIKIVKQ